MSEVNLVQTAQAILSLRDSDFDSYSAYGEAIDNSIDAKAKNIFLITKNDTKKIPRFSEIAFCDDGIGMDEKVLHHCLSLGYSSRYNDRSGIGRFGVGMTLGAVHEASRVEVYSRKEKSKPWLFTYIDLDEMTGVNPTLKSIPKPTPKEIPAEYIQYVGKDHGTCVVWKKYDRAHESSDKMLKEMHFWIGRTFRYYIWEGTNITINDQKVFPWDPLFLKPETTPFPKDEKAKEVPPMNLNWICDSKEGAGATSEIKVRMSLLPYSFRKEQGDGNKDAAKLRKINENEGISIIRNKREVFFGHIPYWKPAFEDKDRWIGVEILFDAVLDQAFTVKIIKRGAVPQPDLKAALMATINGTRKELLKEISKDWTKVVSSGGAGTRPTSLINTPPPPSGETGVDIEKMAITKELIDRIKLTQKTHDLVFEEFPFGSAQFLFELQKKGNKTVIVYNSDHEFYKIFKILKEKVGKSQESYAQDLMILFDLLVTGYGWAECNFQNKEDLGNPEDHFADMRLEWGKKMRDFANTWHKQTGIKDSDEDL